MAKEADASIFQEYLQIIIFETNRLTNLVDKLIGPYKQEQFQTTNIHKILEHCRTLISAEIGGIILSTTIMILHYPKFRQMKSN